MMKMIRRIRQKMIKRSSRMSKFPPLFSPPPLPNPWLKSLQLLIFTMLLTLSLRQNSVYAADIDTSTVQDCEIHKGPCSKKIGAVNIVLNIEPKPVKAMKALTFTVTLKGTREYESLRLTLKMPGMFMGNNVVKLVRVGGGKYSGKGVIPRCPSGKRLWFATVEVPGITSPEPSFMFNVLY